MLDLGPAPLQCDLILPRYMYSDLISKSGHKVRFREGHGVYRAPTQPSAGVKAAGQGMGCFSTGFQQSCHFLQEAFPDLSKATCPISEPQEHAVLPSVVAAL